VTFAPLCPEFVIELRSRSDRKKKLQAKMREYLSQGARMGWLIDPSDGTVEIYRSGNSVEILNKPARLSGEDVLPGFVLDLKGIL
jgi:Uma2 family endonuclease